MRDQSLPRFNSGDSPERTARLLNQFADDVAAALRASRQGADATARVFGHTSAMPDEAGRNADHDRRYLRQADASAKLVVRMGGHVRTGWDVLPGVTLSFTDATRTFTVIDGGAASYYIQGVRHTLGGNKTVVVPNTTGLYFIYFSAETLVASTTPWDPAAEDKAMVATVAWDATNSKSILTGYELHGWCMDGATHGRLHSGSGSAWSTGLQVAEATPAQINVSAGVFFDEDNRIAITNGAGGGLFEQVLSPAQLPIYYRDSTWRRVDAAAKSVATAVGLVSGVALQYNAAGTALASVDTAKFVAMYVVATNDIAQPVALITGQAQYDTLALARDGENFQNLNLNDLPFQEMVRLARIILVQDAMVAPYYAIVDTVDLRATNAGGTATAHLSTDHGALSGLANDDHAQYLLLAGRTGVQSVVGDVSVGGALTTGGDIRLTAEYLRMGVDTNDLIKRSYITGTQYASDAEPEGTFLSGLFSDASRNLIMIGGGSSLANAATEIRMYTAANQTTRTGTERFTILNNGNVGIGVIAPTEMLDVAGNIKATFLAAAAGSLFLVSDSGVIRSRTAEQTLTDIGAEPAGSAEGAITLHQLTYNHDNYNTAYGWGNHADAGYALSGHNHDHATLTNLDSAAHSHLTSVHKTDLTDGGDSVLHYHSADRARAGHTGTQLAATISDFDSAAVTANASAISSAISTHQLTYNHDNYDTAYGWGNHADAGYATGAAISGTQNRLARFDATGASVCDSGVVDDGSTLAIGRATTVTLGASGATPALEYDDLVVHSNASAGITICTPNNRAAGFLVADPENNAVGGLYYGHTSDQLQLLQAGAQCFMRDATGMYLTTNSGGLQISAGAATDVLLKFWGTTNSGLITWMRAEDYFAFADDILLSGTEKIYFNNALSYINSNGSALTVNGNSSVATAVNGAVVTTVTSFGLGIGATHISRNGSTAEGLSFDSNNDPSFVKIDDGWYGPRITIKHVSAAPTAGDLVGSIEFVGKNSVGSEQYYGFIDAEIVDPTAGSINSRLVFSTANVPGTLERGQANNFGLLGNFGMGVYSTLLGWSDFQKSAFGMTANNHAALMYVNEYQRGGVSLRCYSKELSASGVGLWLKGYTENDLTGRGTLTIDAYKHNGAGGLTDVADTHYIINARNNGATKFAVTGNGDVVMAGNLTVTGALTPTGNITLGAYYISHAGTNAGLSLDSDNNATLSAGLTVAGNALVGTSGAGRHLALLRDGPCYIAGGDLGATAGSLIFLTGGRVEGSAGSTLWLRADKKALFSGAVKIQNAPSSTPTDPTEMLEVEGNIKATGTLAIGSSGVFTGMGQLGIKRTDTPNPYISFHDSTGDRVGYLQVGSTIGLLSVNGASSYFGIQVNGSHSLRILADGNVGIGNISPTQKLDVGGNLKVSGSLALGGNIRQTAQTLHMGIATNLTTKRSYIIGSQYAHTDEPEGAFLAGLYSDVTRSLVMIGGGTAAENAAMEIRMYTATNQTTRTGTERFTILNNGNVGIGVIAPTEMLDVAGNIKASGNVIASGGVTATGAVAASNITSGSFTCNITPTDAGGGAPTGTVYWSRAGNIITLCLPLIYTYAADGSTGAALNGIPTAIQPNFSQECIISAFGSSTGYTPALRYMGLLKPRANSSWFYSITPNAAAENSFTPAYHGIFRCTITYLLTQP
jgi:hypothetical protein